ncbi:hypothetical protein HNQ07_002854 [Deinococcus metalli]|uniref:DUF4397 domain-containing protein n=1 Tax=Deinococcus metalli TaxID=1141878 RepID=A0A7W8NSN7_9DEIO|nr:hypothetical protein [Deinococcus metalli]MBB5377362.1 hypothetical protein [Deinococcus metalli]GHF49878.1 hypothetical protein GCM10017781_27880 [Deinococcus metalli]
MRTRSVPFRSLGLALIAAAGLTACGAATVPDTAVGAATVQAASVQPGVNTLAVVHRHSAALPVTFHGLSGAVQVRLVPPAGYVSGLRLDTRTLTLDGADVTQDLVVSAPGLPDFYTPEQSLSAPYTLVVSQDGRDVASAAVSIEEKLLDVRTTVEQDRVSGGAGQPVSFTVVVRVTPPLDGPLPVTLDGCPVEGCGYEAVPVGPVRGNGGEMRQTFTVTVPQEGLPPVGAALDLHYAVAVGDFAGYRLAWYGTRTATLTVGAAP